MYNPTYVDMQRRLKWITVKIGGQLLRKYRLDYEYGASTGRSRLTTIQEYGSDGNILQSSPWLDGSYKGTGKTLSPICFKWQEGGDGTFTSEYFSFTGIAGFDLKSTNDQIFPLDYKK